MLWILLFTAGLGVFLIGMPKNSDDYWFSYHLWDWFGSQGILNPEHGGNILKAGIPWHEIYDTYVEHYHIDCFRLGNMVAVPLLLFPKWVASGIALLLWIYAMFASFRLAGVDWRRSALVPAMLFVWGFLMPWSNTLGCIMFQYNYIPPAAIGLALLLCLRSSAAGWRPLTATALLGFMLGWWHEGFAVPVICGLVALAVLRRDCRNRRFLVAVLAIAAGMCLLLTSPMFWCKAENSGLSKMGIGYIVTSALRATAFNIPYVILCLLVIVDLCRGRRSILHDRTVVFALVSGVVSVMLMFVGYPEWRVSWWAQTISVVAGARILTARCPKLHGYGIRSGIVSACCLVLLYTHWISVDIYTFKVRKIFVDAIDEYCADPTKPVFARIINGEDYPLINYKLPHMAFFGHTERPAMLYFEHLGGAEPFGIVPDCLRRVTSGSGRALRGDIEARIVGNHVFMPARDGRREVSSLYYVETDYGSGFSPRPAWRTKFRSEADGRYYYSLFLYAGWYDQHFRTLEGVRTEQ